jgi:DNA-binding transcriptional ArsR family regulator
MAGKSNSRRPIRTLQLSLNIDAIKDALLGELKERRRIYPAHEAAVKALFELFDSRLHRLLHALTIPMIVELGYSEKTARNAIAKLRSSGILKLVEKGVWSPAKKSMSPNLYELNPAMIRKLVPVRKEDALAAILSTGGTFDQYIRAESACSILETRITGEMVIREYDRQNARISKKLQAAEYFGRPAV